MKNFRSKFFVTLFVLATSAFAFAGSKNQLKLSSGTYPLEPNLDRVTEADFTGLAVNGRYFVYLHFTAIPTAEERKRLESFGVKLHHYLPANTYEAELPGWINPALLVPLGVDGIYAITPDFKMSKQLASGNYPDHALVGDDILLNAQYFEGISKDFAINAIQAAGFEVNGDYAFSRFVTVQVPLSKLNDFASLAFINYVEAIDPPAEPENLVGRTDHRSSYISNGNNYNGGFNGSGVWVAMGDDGFIGPHIDYQGRTDQTLVGPSSGNHGDHVAGTIMGAGNLDPKARGMAWGADLKVYDVWDAVNSTPTSYFNPGVVVTSTSYSNGCNAGYTGFAQTADYQVRTMPNLMHVFSAGNAGTSDCGYGAGAGWGNVTGGVKIGKNVITVANLSYMDGLANSSSRGPAHDGRIKPDISAVGTNVYSCNANNVYAFSSGTSMSCPGVSGTYAQLVEAYRSFNNGATPHSALIKGAILNTADDLGNIGPDFKFGWGRINARRVVEVLQAGTYMYDSITQGNVNVHTIAVPANVKQLNIMVYWNDYEAASNAALALVNDIDMTVTDPGSQTYLPWVLDPTPNPASLNTPATNGVDTLNNMEQVQINNPAAGSYNVTIAGTTIPQGPQTYYIIYEYVMEAITVVYPSGGESFAPGETETIRWDAPNLGQAFTLQYSTDGGTSWNTIASVNAAQRYYDWTVPPVVTGNALIRVSAGSVSDESDQPFNIIGVPGNIQVSSSCPNEFTLTWDPVFGATSYEVSVLGTKYMDSVMTVSSTSATLTGYPAVNTYWVSVKAKAAQITGRRAYAIEKNPGTWNCFLPNDLELTELQSPTGNIYFNCVSYDSVQVSVKLTNIGTSALSNFDLSYNYGNNPVVTETFTGTLAPGASTVFTFNTTFALQNGTNTSFKVWKAQPDDNEYNDTISMPISLLNGMTVGLPYTEDFESFSLCATTTNCEIEVCNLTSGWVNLENGVQDDIDFRVNSGSTPSNNTGPNVDHNPGTSSGKYLYTEASGGCVFMEAVAISPCIDLSNATLPELSFWYHMNGNNMGELHVDLLYEGEWINDVAQPVVGGQGTQWKQITLNLVSYIGSKVNVRIRAITGNGWQSDIAIDDFSVTESTVPPTAAFDSDLDVACVNEVITFMDMSTGVPNSWQWSFFPNTVSFVNGTSASSMNPQVEFLNQGTYSVKLVVSNPNGQDSVFVSNYINVVSGQPLPVSEDFEALNFPPQDWTAINPDNGQTWVDADNIIGADGNPTKAAYVANFTYNAAGAEDYLEIFTLDLSQVNTARLYFDVAYRPYDASFKDRLRIDVSTDCGKTFVPSGYDKEGAVLATGPAQTSAYTPGAASDWRRDSVDLSGFAGGRLLIRFTNVCGYGNNLYIDNVNIENYSFTAAVIDADTMVCVNDTLVVNDLSQGVNLTYQWDFGADATPASATTAGPHQVIYSDTGTKNISLVVTGDYGTDSATYAISVVDLPEAGYSWVYDPVSNTVAFTNTSTWIQSVLWDFDDGTTSTDIHPVHQFPSKGYYDVKLTVSNPCGSSDTTIKVGNFPVGIIENGTGRGSVAVFPNPSGGLFTLEFTGIDNEWVDIRIYNLQGKLIDHQAFEAGDGSNRIIDLRGNARGVYLLKVSSAGVSGHIRLLVQ